MTRYVTIFLLTVVAPAATAQIHSPHAYLPIDHWATPIIEHLIDRGAIEDPSPMTRPWTVGLISRALAAADQAAMSGPERATVSHLLRVLAPQSGDRAIMGETEFAIRSSTHARRPALSLREEGDGHTTPQIALKLGMQFGPGLILMSPRWDSNIDDDPDYGGRDKPVKVRFPEAYAAYRSRYFDVDVGAVSRNWGPAGMPGVLLSNQSLSYDQLYVRMGPRAVNLEMVVAQLESQEGPNGGTRKRYYVAHRLTTRPWSWMEAAIWEGTTISAGPARSFELWYLNPFKIHFQTEDERLSRTNVWVGGEGQLHFGGWRFGGAITIDDIQLFSTPARDDEPPSWALTALASGPVGPVRVFLGYTQVSNLMYRTPDPTESPLIATNPERGRIGTGLARTYSDYDQATLRATFVAAPALLVGPELTLLRQGEGDIRLPFPTDAEYPLTANLFQGVVERTLRAAIVASYHHPIGVSADIDLGVHRVTNADNVLNQTRNDVVGTFRIRYTFRRGWALN